MALVASAITIHAAPMSGILADCSSKGISLRQVEYGQRLRNGPAEVLRTYNKYAWFGSSGKRPYLVQRVAETWANASVEARPEDYETSYTCTITIGQDSFDMNIDTGSADLWVFSAQLPGNLIGNHTAYNPSKSGQPLQNHSWGISYADGSGAAGIVYSDKVVVGGATVTNQAVQAATSISQSFVVHEKYDGIVGLGFNNMNTVKPQQQKTFFDNVKDSIPQRLFTATLKHNSPGSYDFGFLNRSKFRGEIVYVPVDASRGLWTFDAGSFSVGNGRLQGRIGKAVADTGTTLLFVPQGIANAYYNQAPGARYDRSQGGYIVPCDSRQLPAFNIQIGSQTISVPGYLLTYSPVGQGMCFGGIQPSQQRDFNIFGDIFLKAVYAVFDMTQDQPRLGFAPQA
ncbi:aspartyl protease [Piedraia hortae CBS 480.64]|uniref:Aspartyl protease n=1 Tax=Piedraia hortae CBS 480.64 TaxID=1314780 RepID=A0A6A7C9R3_9PEZI|nr:aspartyl protease [Piedraia hortae CBS 480.64]